MLITLSGACTHIHGGLEDIESYLKDSKTYPVEIDVFRLKGGYGKFWARLSNDAVVSYYHRQFSELNEWVRGHRRWPRAFMGSLDLFPLCAYQQESTDTEEKQEEPKETVRVKRTREARVTRSRVRR